MDHIGMDAHKKESQLCILTEAGELIASRAASCASAAVRRQGQVALLSFREAITARSPALTGYAVAGSGCR